MRETTQKFHFLTQSKDCDDKFAILLLIHYYFRINNVLQLNFFVSVLFLGIAAGSLRSVNSKNGVLNKGSLQKRHQQRRILNHQPTNK